LSRAILAAQDPGGEQVARVGLPHRVRTDFTAIGCPRDVRRCLPQARRRTRAPAGRRDARSR